MRQALSSFLCLGWLAFASLGHSETILLRNGSHLEGEILKQSDEAYFIDLGFDILKVPADAVAEVGASDEETPSDAGLAEEGDGSEGVATMDGEIFSTAVAPETRSVKENAALLSEAVVQIRTPSGLGSGFIIHPDGYVITNNHVISGEHRIAIILFKRQDRSLKKLRLSNVRIVATSPVMDLALLKIEGEEQPNYPHVPIGRSRDVRSGQSVFAIGSPLGFERSVSQGIVSVRNRVASGGLIYLQHTAQINPGNSGGPLFNLQGEVIGVLNMKLVATGVEGMGFAIPASMLKLFLENRDAYAFDPRHPNAGFRYLDPPGAEPDPVAETEPPLQTATEL